MDIAARLPGNRGSVPGSGKILLFSTVSRPRLGLTQPPFHCIPGNLSPEIKWPRRKAHFHLVLTLRMSGGVPSLPIRLRSMVTILPFRTMIDG